MPVDRVMDSGVDKEGVDVGEERIQEVPAQASFLPLVEMKPGDQVGFGLVEDLDSHRSLSRISVFADSQSTKRTVSSSILRRRSSRISPCQSGDSMASGERRDVLATRIGFGEAVRHFGLSTSGRRRPDRTGPTDAYSNRIKDLCRLV